MATVFIFSIQSSAEGDEESHHRRKKKVSSSKDTPKSSDHASTGTGGMGSGRPAVEGGEEGKDMREGESEAGRSRTTKWADKWDLKEHNT